MENKRKRVGWLFARTGRKRRKLIERELSATNVYRAQHQILMMLSKDNGISQTEIAKEQECSTATVAVSLKKLEQGGYIKRVVNQEDNRFNQVAITEKGNAVVKQSMDIFYKCDELMFEGFNEPELEQLEKYLDRIHENLKKYVQ